MPMPVFPYAQGHFCRAVNQIYADEGSRARNCGIVLERLSERPMDANEMTDLSEDFRDGRLDLKGLEEQKKIKRGEADHFFQHWLSPNAPIFAPSYQITPNEIAKVMCEGYRTALGEATKCDPPLPISVAWICQGSAQARFEMVTIVNPHVHVQVLIVTPPPQPLTAANYEPDRDNVLVTRLMRTPAEIQQIITNLNTMGAPVEEQIVLNPLGSNAQPNEVGTFRIWT